MSLTFTPEPLEARPDVHTGDYAWKVVRADRPNICTALHCNEADATLYAAAPAMRRALVAAEAFIAGFEGDVMQEGVDALLADIRTALSAGLAS